LDNHDELKLALNNLAQQYIHSLMQSNYLELMRVIIAESPRCPQLGELFRSTLPDKTLRSVSTILGQAKNKGLVNVSDTKVAVRMFIESTKLIAFWAIHFPWYPRRINIGHIQNFRSSFANWIHPQITKFLFVLHVSYCIASQNLETNGQQGLNICF
jgi:hypothetical protein